MIRGEVAILLVAMRSLQSTLAEVVAKLDLLSEDVKGVVTAGINLHLHVGESSEEEGEEDGFPEGGAD